MDSLKNQSDRGYEYYKQNKKRRSSVSGSGSSVSGSGSSVSGSGSSVSQSGSSVSQSGSYSRPYSE